MRRRISVISFIVFMVFFLLIPMLISMLFSALASRNISGKDVVRVVSVGLESARTEFGNFFSSGPFDPALREIWIVVVAVAIPVITFLVVRQEVKK